MQIESLLDESTAELAKMEFTPLLSTIEANFKLKKAVPLHTTLRIDCKVVITPPPPVPIVFPCLLLHMLDSAVTEALQVWAHPCSPIWYCHSFIE